DKGEGKLDRWLVLTGLGDMHTQVGAAHLRMGEPAVALHHFRKVLEARRATEAEPKNPQKVIVRRGIAQCLHAIGDASGRLKDPTTAAASFEESIKEYQALVDKYPKVIMLKQYMEWALIASGDFYLRSGDPKKARPLYEKSLAIAEEIVKLDARQMTYQ